MYAFKRAGQYSDGEDDTSGQYSLSEEQERRSGKTLMLFYLLSSAHGRAMFVLDEEKLQSYSMPFAIPGALYAARLEVD